jgi:hypothetical protein
MSVTVNGIEIPINKNDTNENIKFKIALSLKTFPKYLYGLPETFNDGDELKVMDIFDLLKSHTQKSTDFKLFIDKPDNRKKINELNLNIKTDILYPWLAYNTFISQLSKMNTQIVNITGEKLVKEGYFSNINEFTNFWQTKNNYKSNIENELSNLTFIEEKYGESQAVLEEYKGKYYSEFIVEKVSLKTYLNIKDTTILEIFNMIVCNKNVPFASCNNYYKILNDYLPPESWSFSFEDKILLKVQSKAENSDQFTNIFIGIENEQTYALMEISVDKSNISEKEYLQRIRSVFPDQDITFSEPIQNRIIGSFYFPETYINSYVLSDLIMNDYVFSTYLNTLEFNKVSKKIDKTGQTWLSIYYNEGDKFVSASLARKTIDRRETYIKTTDEKTFPHGEPAVKVHAKGENIELLRKFQDKLSVLLELYENKEKEIIDIYKKILPDFGEYEIESVSPLKKREIAKDLFVSNFSRLCPNVPTVIDREEAERLLQNNEKDVLKFPRDEVEEGEKFDSDGKNQKYYVCNYEEYKYPGVKINKTLSNKKQYPFIPCCYKTPQTGFEDSEASDNYKEYYSGIKKVKKEGIKQQKLIVTKKFAASDKFGRLPDTINSLFNILNTEPTLEFIRMGVDRNKSSFLNCVLTALKQMEIIGEENRSKVLSKTRRKLSKNSILSKQCGFKYTLEQLTENIKNPDIYLDPKIYIQLIEEVYNCNIYLFSPEKMLLPNFIEGLYRVLKDGNTIIIYEHMGSASDAATYPQCELIVRWDPKVESSVEYSYKRKDSISRKLYKLYNTVNDSYVSGKRIKDQNNIYSEYIISQVLDEYGKCRCLNFVYEDFSFSIFTSPIQPLNIEVVNKSKISYIDIEESSKVRNILSTIYPGISFIDSFNGTIGLVNISLKLSKDNQEVKSSSKIDIFNRNKKIARYLVQYTLWAFSNYHNKKGGDLDENIQRFRQKGFKIESEHQYRVIPKQFRSINDIIINDKIVVTSEEMKNRLMYSLIINKSRIEDYYKIEKMPDYYRDITDFDEYSDQIILYGEESVQKWLLSNKKHYLQKSIQPGDIPYFFQNKNIGDQVYLAQNTDFLGKALDIGYSWIKNQINVGEMAVNFTGSIGFNLYVYRSEDDIEKFIVRGQEISRDINIIGYKINDVPYYTVLLDQI